MDNRFVIDWITFTTKLDSVESIIDVMGLGHISFGQLEKGRYGYATVLHFDGINICYNGHSDDMGICVEMSGKGCRAFDTYSTLGFNALFDLIIDNNHHMTRLDVAYDDFDGIVPLKQLREDIENLNFVSRFKRGKFEKSIDFSKRDNVRHGETIYIGSKKSEVLFRFYDKLFEQEDKGIDHGLDSWVRCEIQLRNDRALNFIKLYNGENLGDLWCGVLLNYFRVIIPGTNAVLSRCTVADYWQKLIRNAVKVKIFTPVESDYTVNHLERFVTKGCGGAISTYAEIVGIDSMMDVIENTPRMENPKYTRLLHDVEESKRLNSLRQKSVLPKPAPAPKKQRTEYPNFTLSESILVQMEFDVDVLSADFLTGYKPYKYD